MLPGEKDAVFIYGKPSDLRLKFVSKNYSGNKSYWGHISATPSVATPPRRDLHISAGFSVTHLAMPTVKVMFSGTEHRSWVDIMVSSVWGTESEYFQENIGGHEQTFQSNVLINSFAVPEHKMCYLHYLSKCAKSASYYGMQKAGNCPQRIRHKVLLAHIFIAH